MANSSRSFFAWRRRKETLEKAELPRLTRKRDLFLAFAIVSLPLLAIALLLIVFTFKFSQNKYLDFSIGTRELPASEYDLGTFYYTSITTGSFLLVGSWASNFATMVVAPFMVLFSYTVAREMIFQQSSIEKGVSDAPLPLLREIMGGTYDNWLHTTTRSISLRFYGPVSDSKAENGQPPWEDYQAGFSTFGECTDMLNTPLPANISSAPLPCSLDESFNLANVVNPSFVYLTLGKGISQTTANFNGINFTSQLEGEDKNTATPYQIVTHSDNGLSHSLFFYPDAAREYDLSEFGLGHNWGIDFVAETTSMVTECTFATPQCEIENDSVNSGPNNMSIPFHCYNDFSGNLGQTPLTGHERAQGWNMSFYDLIDGSPKNIPVQSQSNPFHFYAATAVNSIDLEDFQSQTEGSQGNDSVVDAGSGFIAFALNCQATIYDVTYSLVNGSFYEFNATKSSPQKASIIKAPLQVGFGQYQLYLDASIAVLANNDSIPVTMGTAFSQTAMALASGVFDFDNNTMQRERYNANVTEVRKAPLIYLVVVCLVYSMFGMAMTVMAFYLRRVPGVREQQRKLMVEWTPDLYTILVPTGQSVLQASDPDR
ncbi:MAG: hypothetical protein Q9170_006304 [Blastenia crenularia]